MSVRKLGSSSTLPANPTWLEFPRTDGDASILPTNTQKIVDHDGHVNFMRPVGLDESTSINWRVGVATQLAKRMNLPEGPKYVLKTFPEGYHMYDHNKGPQSAPRHDPYLCGSVNVNRFRSVNEFIPHALWLMQDATMDRHNCECKYCAKQPQRAVTAALGLPGQRSPSVITSAPTRGPRPPREPRPRLTKPYAAVRPAPKPVKALTGPQQFLTPERNGDIMYALAHGDDRASRWFRKGELVWCALAPAIRGRTAEEDIIFWPGLVEEVHLKTQAVPRVPEDGVPQNAAVDLSGLYEEAHDDADETRPPSALNSAPAPLDEKGRTSWKVRQWNVYKMKLLAVTHNYIVTDEQVVPYLAYAPSGQLLHAVTEVFTQIMSEIPIEEMDDNIQKVFTFDPLGPEDDIDGGFILKFRQAVMPYTLAIEIASNLASYWLPTDDWNCKFTITPPPTPPSAQPQSQPPPPSQPEQPQPTSLHSLITMSMANNAIPDPDARVASRAQPSSFPTESVSTRIVGRTSAPQIISQMRYQGLWWGAERIWTDELVRLKLARCQFAPKGTDIIYPPAGPSASTLASIAGGPDGAIADPDSLGAAQKGLFLRLEGLFVVDATRADGSVAKECRASGMLYELVDDDWEGDESGQNEGEGTAKGKERSNDVNKLDVFNSSAGTSVHTAGQGFTALPSLHGPSPLRPPPLPNPDPTVPVFETAAEALAQTVAASKAKKRNMDVQLSHPVLSTPYPLPIPPKGFKFRPILPPDHEVVLSLSLISGRYYPRLFAHPLMAPTVDKALCHPPEQGGLYEYGHLWAMDGLLPGVHQSMDPTFWRGSRVQMLKDSDAAARESFKQRWDEIKSTRLHSRMPSFLEGSSHDMPMEID